MGTQRAGQICWTLTNLPSLCPHPTWRPRGPAYVERGVELANLGLVADLGLEAVAVLAWTCKFCTECCVDGNLGVTCIMQTQRRSSV
jgi:hypothetical protein